MALLNFFFGPVMCLEPRLNATLTFTLHDKTTSNPTNFWLFFVVAYVSSFKFCRVMSYQQQQRDMYPTCDTYASIFWRFNASFLRTHLPPLVNNFIVFLGFPPPFPPQYPSLVECGHSTVILMEIFKFKLF